MKEPLGGVTCTGSLCTGRQITGKDGAERLLGCYTSPTEPGEGTLGAVSAQRGRNYLLVSQQHPGAGSPRPGCLHSPPQLVLLGPVADILDQPLDTLRGRPVPVRPGVGTQALVPRQRQRQGGQGEGMKPQSVGFVPLWLTSHSGQLCGSAQWLPWFILRAQREGKDLPSQWGVGCLCVSLCVFASVFVSVCLCLKKGGAER